MTRDEMYAYALSLPEVEESTVHGARCVRLRGKLLINDTRLPDAVSLSLDHGDIDLLMETEPQTWFKTPHFDGWPAVLVRYEAADDDRLREQIDKAWARRATKAQLKARGL
ncbi:MmcQ/YjbR family DNA-binding protein [Brevundimonas sp.]|uniref:MmcQ/YjbR family DNA-binding protein n=1 Tax=Brevundimonas sp. TaxID=1871086 RepID=UPI002B71AC47|nr:MmcQ/YjbR family DNA-binding protein [Brevundimonas sp.]HWQ87707.1 MmcQ/YjbR family DNA-binding protein [Brevundimonas sp.]